MTDAKRAASRPERRPAANALLARRSREPYLTHVPTMTEGTGRAEVERFYRGALSVAGAKNGQWRERLSKKRRFVTLVTSQNPISDAGHIAKLHIVATRTSRGELK
jgi:hypothetical protein